MRWDFWLIVDGFVTGCVLHRQSTPNRTVVGSVWIQPNHHYLPQNFLSFENFNFYHISTAQKNDLSHIRKSFLSSGESTVFCLHKLALCFFFFVLLSSLSAVRVSCPISLHVHVPWTSSKRWWKVLDVSTMHTFEGEFGREVYRSVVEKSYQMAQKKGLGVGVELRPLTCRANVATTGPSPLTPLLLFLEVIEPLNHRPWAFSRSQKVMEGPCSSSALSLDIRTSSPRPSSRSRPRISTSYTIPHHRDSNPHLRRVGQRCWSLDHHHLELSYLFPSLICVFTLSLGFSACLVFLASWHTLSAMRLKFTCFSSRQPIRTRLGHELESRTNQNPVCHDVILSALLECSSLYVEPTFIHCTSLYMALGQYIGSLLSHLLTSRKWRQVPAPTTSLILSSSIQIISHRDRPEERLRRTDRVVTSRSSSGLHQWFSLFPWVVLDNSNNSSSFQTFTVFWSSSLFSLDIRTGSSRSQVLASALFGCADVAYTPFRRSSSSFSLDIQSRAFQLRDSFSSLLLYTCPNSIFSLAFFYLNLALARSMRGCNFISMRPTRITTA